MGSRSEPTQRCVRPRDTFEPTRLALPIKVKLAKAQVVEQVIGQPDLSATALKLAEVTKAKELFHQRLMCIT